MDDVHFSTVVSSCLKAEFKGMEDTNLLLVYICDCITIWEFKWKCGKWNVTILCYNISRVLQQMSLFKVWSFFPRNSRLKKN